MKFRMFILLIRAEGFILRRLRRGMLIPIAVFALTGCSKKSAPPLEKVDSKSETVSTAQFAIGTQSEHSANAVFEQETPSSEIDSWSNEDKFTIRKMKRHIRMLSADDLVESKPMGTYKLYYDDIERVWAPVTSITDTDLNVNGKAAYAKFSSCLNAKKPSTLRCFNRNGIALIAIEEENKADNILTLLFSNDQAKTWNMAYIEIASEYLGEKKYPRYYPFCTDLNTGYLLLGGMEKIIVDGSYSGEKIPGAHIFRTQDAGVSWEEIGRISDTVEHYLFVQENTVFLGGRKVRYPCLFKSDDYTNWGEIDFPVDTKKYLSGRFDGFVFEGEYGIVKAYMNLREDGYEIISFATKDGGKSWALWND